MLAVGLVKSNPSFGFIPTRGKVEEHSVSDRHLFNSFNNIHTFKPYQRTDRGVNMAEETLAFNRAHSTSKQHEVHFEMHILM